MQDQVDCLGISVTRMDWGDFRHWLSEQLRRDSAQGPARLYIVNAHTLNLAWTDREYRHILESATLILNDGVGVEMAARLGGVNLPYNFNGTDLIPRLFREVSNEGGRMRVFLYGAMPGRAEEMARVIHERYPNIEIAGTLHGYHRDDDFVLTTINQADADLVLVAKGNPLQEQWIHAHAPRMRARVIAGVGALFDFMSGRMQRAPECLRAFKLEWAYRLWLEPRRMARRYVLGNPLFLTRAILHQAKNALHP